MAFQEVDRLQAKLAELQELLRQKDAAIAQLHEQAKERWGIWAKHPRGIFEEFRGFAACEFEAEYKKQRLQKELDEQNSKSRWGVLDVEVVVQHEVCIPYEAWVSLQKCRSMTD